MQFVSNTTISIKNIGQIDTLIIKQNAIKKRNISTRLMLKNKFCFASFMWGITRQFWQKRKRNNNSNKTRTLNARCIKTLVYAKMRITIGCSNNNKSKMSTMRRIFILVYRSRYCNITNIKIAKKRKIFSYISKCYNIGTKKSKAKRICFNTTNSM